MTVLSAIQAACPVIGLDVPSLVYGSTDREWVEMGALANEMAERIATDHDWQALRRLHSFTGDDVATDFALPADYARMLKDSNVWSSRVESPLRHVVSLDEWLELDIRSYEVFIGAWTIYGDRLHIKPVATAAENVRFFYVSRTYARSSAGADKAAFTADDDVFRLSSRLLTLGIIWQWRANKGLPYAEDMVNFERVRDRLAADDKGARVLRIGRGRMRYGANLAYPEPILP
jgi:hypothetical protein